MARRKRHRSKSAGPSTAAAVESARPTNAEPDECSSNSSETATPPAEADAVGDDRNASVLAAVRQNTDLLTALIEALADQRSQAAGVEQTHTADDATESNGSSNESDNDEPRSEQDWWLRCEDLQRTVDQLTDEVEQLTGQLDVERTRRAEAEEIAERASNGCEHTNGDAAETANPADGLIQETSSWEDRKRDILKQLESDSFDAEAFAESLAEEHREEAAADPTEFCRGLLRRLEDLQDTNAGQSSELRQLRGMLDEQSTQAAGGDVAVGAAALVSLLDDDELVREERQRLADLREEWEEKFRRLEVESSVQKAKLSRERQEFADKVRTLEEELEQTRRQVRVQEETGGAKRRWLGKLGLAD